jgi:hypothetical protein
MTTLEEPQLRFEAVLRDMFQRPHFTLDEAGRATVSADDESITIDLPPGSDEASFVVVLGQVPHDADRRVALYAKALQFNLFLDPGRGAATACTDDGLLVLCCRVNAQGLDPIALDNVISNFAAITKDARQQLFAESGEEDTAAFHMPTILRG